MPSFFRRLFGFSFRTERLIMNIIGLINSTFDWSPLKWTNELEQIQNISLTYGTLILGTIGEDTIKTVLSWIVITRIVIAHVYTFFYLTNMYSILTWSRPNLLLPWLILSFFKNVVLEVIVLAVCLLYWYDKRFSLAIFLEFVIVKIVPLIVATYNWYSTSCLFLELRHVEKLTKFKRNLRSDTNFLTGRLFAKITDSKYRSRSLVTLLSYESFETVDTQDTISRVIDDPDLTPVQKTMKILGITQQDIAAARIRTREMAVHRRLTEIDDEPVGTERSMPSKFLMLGEDDGDEQQIGSFLERKDELAIEHSTMVERASSPSSQDETKEGTVELPPPAEFEFSRKKGTEPDRAEDADASKEQTKETVLTRGREEIDASRTNEARRDEQCPSCASSLERCRRKRSIEKTCHCPQEARSLFNCDCSIDAKFHEETEEHCCLFANEIVPKSSTTKGSPDTATTKSDRRESEFRSSVYGCNPLNDEKTNDGVTLIEDRTRIDEGILEEIKGRACSRRLTAKEKLKAEVEQVTSRMENLEISDRKTLEDNAENPCSERSGTKEESKTVKDDSRAKTLIADEDLKRRVLLVTDKIDNILRNFEHDPSSRRSTTEQRLENRCVAVGADKLSIILKDTIRKPVPLTNFRAAATIDSQEDTGPTPMGHRYEAKVGGNRLTATLPEYSFGDTGIRRFFEDSMKVFDGCREQNFDELRCIYRQLEKNKWNPFVGRSSLETPFKREDDIDRSTVPSSANDRERMETERSKTAAASPSKSAYHREGIISRKSQVNERFLDNVSGKLAPRKLASITPSRSCYAQTDLARPSSDKPFERVVTVSKSRKNACLKRKRLQDQASVSSIREQRDDKADTRYSPNCHRAQKRNKQRYDPKRQPNDPESPESGRSVCECKMQQLEAECSESRLDSSSNKKDDRRGGKLGSFGTVTLSRVTRELEGVAHRKKPPIYPKKPKPKVPCKNPLPKIAPITRKLEESKRTNANGRTECLEDAREMRALKAYNEVTLLRDKEHFDAKRKALSSKITLELLPEQSKHRVRSKRSNSGKKVGQDSKSMADEQVDKENLSADKSATASASDDVKSVNESVRFFASSDENFACSNLSKVNRVTNKIFDRLFSIPKQSREKSSSIADADTRKRFSKYSNPKRMLDEQIVSASSSKRLEGTQTGRELERTPASQDIRDRFAATDRTSPGIESNEGDRDVEKQQDCSLLTIKASVNRDTASAWSGNTVDGTHETRSLLGGYPRTEDRSPFSDDAKTDSEQSGDREEPSETKRNDSEADFERDSGNVDSLEEENEGSGGGNSDYRDSSRNIDVSYLVHGVVLSNANATASKQPRLHDIVDDATSRLLHNAFSYRSMDSLFDFTEDRLSLVANGVANESHWNALDDGFVCRSSNDAVDVFTDEIAIFSRAPNNLEQTVVRELDRLRRPEESCVREAEHLTRELIPRAGIDEFRLDDVLASIGQLLRTLNADSFALENVDEPSFGILRGLSRQDEAEQVQRSTVEENDATAHEENEESSEEADRTLRFVEENIFTDIEFPIVIDWSESLAVSNRAPEFPNSMLDRRQIQQIKRLGSLSFDDSKNEEKKTEEGAKLVGETTKNVEQSVFFGKLELSFEPGRSSRRGSDFELVGSCTSVCSEEASTGTYRRVTNATSASSAARSEEHVRVETIEEREEETERKVELERVEGIGEETARSDESEGTGDNTRSIEYEDEKEETTEAEGTEEIYQDQKLSAESNDRVSWANIGVIFLIVCWLYVRHIWQALVESSRSSPLKPFEIHAVPAPTVALLRRIANDEKEENFEASRGKKISSYIAETEDRDSEEIEEEVAEATLLLGQRISENVRIPSLSNSDQQRTRSDLSSIARTTVQDVEAMPEQVGSKAGSGEILELRAAEQEIRTFQFEEADNDSGSANSLFEQDEQTTLFVDSVRAEAKLAEDELAKEIEEIGEGGGKNEQDVLSDDGDPRKEEYAEDGRFLTGETTFAEGKVEEAEGSTEKRKGSSPKTVKSSLLNIDSFDSTYSEISDTSKRTASTLEESFMEEFHSAFDEGD